MFGQKLLLHPKKRQIFDDKLPYLGTQRSTFHAKTQSWRGKLNFTQLSDFRWVDFSSIFEPDNYVIHQQEFIHFFKKKPKFIQQVLNNFELYIAGLDVGMKRHLWGVSLWFLYYIMGMISSQLSKNPQNHQIPHNLQQSMNKIEYIRLKGKNGKLITKAGEVSLRYWTKVNRRNPFTYQHKERFSRKVIAVLLVVFLLMILYKWWE